MKILTYIATVLTLAFAVLGVVKFVELSQTALVSQPVFAAPLPAETATPTPESSDDMTSTAEKEMVQVVPTPRSAEDLASGLFVNITTDDLNRSAMAISFATRVLNQTDKPVTLFFNVEGVRLLDTTIPEQTYSNGLTPRDMIQTFMDDGGVVLICPMCLKNVGGMEEDEIMEGVLIGGPDYTWEAMFAEDVTVLSY